MDSFVKRAEQEVGSEYKRLRWMVGLNGALSVAVGVLILGWPGISLFALTILIGAYMTANGVVGLGSAISGRVRKQRGWLAVASIFSEMSEPSTSPFGATALVARKARSISTGNTRGTALQITCWVLPTVAREIIQSTRSA